MIMPTPTTTHTAAPARDTLALIDHASAGVLLTCLPSGGPTVLARLCQSLQATRSVKTLYLMQPEEDDGQGAALSREAARLQISELAGPDALRQMLRAAPPQQVVVLVDGNGPLLCPVVVDAVVAALRARDRMERVSSNLGSGRLPTGLDVTASTAQALLAEPPALGMPSWQRCHEIDTADLSPRLRRVGRLYAAYDLSLRAGESQRALGELARRLDQSTAPHDLTRLLGLLNEVPVRRASQPLFARRC